MRRATATAPHSDLFAAAQVQVQAQAQVYDNGLVHVPFYLDADAQAALAADVEAILAAAPLFRPVMPKSGKAFSVRMSNCGPLGWVSDRERGYRYQPLHPETHLPWPPMPALALKAWAELAGSPVAPEACLINVYDVAAHMGLHQDRDEDDLSAPVLSLSLGSSCIFRFGGTTRGGRTRAIELRSGDALLLAGAARLAYHGVARILPGTSRLIKDDGRINLTLRRVMRPG